MVQGELTHASSSLSPLPQKVCDYAYNIVLHPCARLPGPLLFRMTIFPNLYYSWKGTKHLKVYELHKQYGKSLGPRFPQGG